VAAPTITQIHDSVRPRSGRVAIEGSGFETGGTVYINGIASWTSSWRDTRIVAYVPETAELGPTTLYVEVNGQQSNEVPIEVTSRERVGRVKWRFETDGTNLWWRPALAPDGTIYIHTNNDYDGIVYALSPNGALKWIRIVNWYPYVPPTAGPDGALYVGSIGTIYRISPGGFIDWTYNPSNGVNIEVSPTIGPDGRLYGAFEISGAFAIEPLTGEVLWENPGDPMLSDKSGEAVETVFGHIETGQPQEQFYISMDGGGGFHAFDFDGDQLFTSSLGNLKGTAEAAIGSDGTIYGPRAIGLTVVALDPTDGSLLWEYYPQDWATGTDNVKIGPDDTLYFVGSSAKLEALDPSNQRRIWQVFDAGTCLDRPTVTPDGSTLVLAGSLCGTSGSQGFVRGLNSRNGHQKWNVDLPHETNPGYRIYGTHHPRITPDGQTAYISTYSLIEWPLADDHTFLYAIDISESGCSPPEVNGVQHDPDKTTLRWSPHGGTATYDVARGNLDSLDGEPGPTCMADDISQAWYEDLSTPPDGAGYYYIVRSTTSCGTGSWGKNSAGQNRNGSCP
jgi:outer membrane protein assembly factor BamB